MKAKLIINEVDCYIGNHNNLIEFATHKATQHQILLSKEGVITPLGRLNGVSDSDRSERIIHSIECNENVVSLFEDCVSISKELRSEYCNSIEDFNSASEYNSPFKAKITQKLKQIWESINIDVDFISFKNVIWY